MNNFEKQINSEGEENKSEKNDREKYWLDLGHVDFIGKSGAVIRVNIENGDVPAAINKAKEIDTIESEKNQKK